MKRKNVTLKTNAGYMIPCSVNGLRFLNEDGPSNRLRRNFRGRAASNLYISVELNPSCNNYKMRTLRAGFPPWRPQARFASCGDVRAGHFYVVIWPSPILVR
jgi:hypothetical protein